MTSSEKNTDPMFMLLQALTALSSDSGDYSDTCKLDMQLWTTAPPDLYERVIVAATLALKYRNERSFLYVNIRIASPFQDEELIELATYIFEVLTKGDTVAANVRNYLKVTEHKN